MAPFSLRDGSFVLSIAHSSYWVTSALASQYLPRPALEALQLRRLRAMLAYAERNVPFYRDLWSQAGVSPSSVRTLEDLRRFPVPSRRQIEDDPSSIVSREHLELHRAGTGYIRRSGGSSGGPQLEIHSDAGSWSRLDGFYYRAFAALGYRPWHSLAYFWSAPFKKRAHNLLGLMPKVGVPAMLDEGAQLAILEQNPGIWWYYHPTSLFPLAKRFPERLRATRPARVICHAELLPDSMRAVIEDVMGAPVFNQYGTSEFNRMAWECPEKRGYHIDADSVIFEIVDDDGRPVRPGETGRVIATGLINRMMPLIRYELGDLVVASDRRCACGRTLPMIERIEGRQKDVFPLPDGGRRTPREMLEPWATLPGVEQFRVTVESSESVKLEVVTRATDLSTLVAEARKRFEVLCPGVAFSVERIADIEKAPTGKRVLIRNPLRARARGTRPEFTL
jgi:phenylacetate-CoA ligase